MSVVFYCCPVLFCEFLAFLVVGIHSMKSAYDVLGKYLVNGAAILFFTLFSFDFLTRFRPLHLPSPATVLRRYGGWCWGETRGGKGTFGFGIWVGPRRGPLSRLFLSIRRMGLFALCISCFLCTLKDPRRLLKVDSLPICAS